MGNYRFRLSDMMPNAWFYKLRDMSKLKNQPIKKNLPSNPRKSFYYSTRMDITSPTNPKFFDTPFPYDPPPKSSKRKTIYMPSPRKITPTSSDDHDFPESLTESDPYDGDSLAELSSSDIILETSSYALKLISELQLPPIVTKSKNVSSSPPANQKLKRNRGSPGGRKSVSRGGGVRIRRRKSVKKGMFCTESFAVVKASFDPEKDFRDSMMEMIVENNIRESKDLEDLLACYLSLNENQYHDHIIKAFEQIWFHIPRLQL